MEVRLREEILANLREGKLPCAVAHAIADRLEVERAQVGALADELDIRVSHCQLGLFGYGEKKLGQHKIVRPVERVQPAVEAAIKEALQDGKVTCAQLFEIAERLGQPRLVVSAHVDALGFKIVECQLGCF